MFKIGDVVEMDCSITGLALKESERRVPTKTFIMVGKSQNGDRFYFCRVFCSTPCVYSVKREDLFKFKARKNIAIMMQHIVEEKQNAK